MRAEAKAAPSAPERRPRHLWPPVSSARLARPPAAAGERHLVRGNSVPEQRGVRGPIDFTSGVVRDSPAHESSWNSFRCARLVVCDSVDLRRARGALPSNLSGQLRSVSGAGLVQLQVLMILVDYLAFTFNFADNLECPQSDGSGQGIRNKLCLSFFCPVFESESILLCVSFGSVLVSSSPVCAGRRYAPPLWDRSRGRLSSHLALTRSGRKPNSDF